MNWLLLVAAVIALVFGLTAFFGAPFVPSQKRYLRRAFDQLYKVSSKDLLVDIGSGDGRVLRLAAERGARAVGYEINPVLVLISKVLNLKHPKASVRLADFWYSQLPPDTTVVYAFSVNRDADKLVAKLQTEADRLSRPLKLICYGSPLKNVTPTKKLDAYYLYTFRPLQPLEAQV